MSWRPELSVPYSYSTSERTLDWFEDWLLAHHHPEFVRRLLVWLDSKAGLIGIGSGWRAPGTQPTKAGFAPPGKSFHETQSFADGFQGTIAVDLVQRRPGGTHTAPAWANVPKQGSPEAATYGVHVNVSTESWHMQPVEVDGYTSWLNAGRPAPRPGYPIPGRPGVPTPTVATPTGTPAPIPATATTAPSQIVIPDGTPSMRLGATGDRVRQLQYALKVGADGQFGPVTDRALRTFQTNVRITVDGVYGEQSEAALRRHYGAQAA